MVDRIHPWHINPNHPALRVLEDLAAEQEGKFPRSQLETLGEAREQVEATNPNSPSAGSKDQKPDSKQRPHYQTLGQHPIIARRLARSVQPISVGDDDVDCGIPLQQLEDDTEPSDQ